MTALNPVQLKSASASLAILMLAACNGQLAVVDDLETGDSNLSGDGSSRDEFAGGSSGPGPGGAPTSLPLLVGVPCSCATSASLMALACSGREVPLLDNDIVQSTADGNAVAFNMDDGFGGFQIVYWTAGSPPFSPGNGLMVGLSASGDQLLVGGELGLELIDVTGSAMSIAMDAIHGRGSLSASGDTVFGAVYDESGAELARADAATGTIERLGLVGASIMRAYVTPDASTIVGFGSNIDFSPNFTSEYIESNRDSLSSAFRWNSQGLAAGFPGAPGGLWPEAVSADGTTIAGRVRSQQAHFRWSESAGYEEIAASAWTTETLISGDGSVILGSLDPEGADETAAFRWTAATGAVDVTPGFASYGVDMSDDGSVVVATSWEPEQQSGAFPESTYVWDTTNGTRTLDGVLQDRGIDSAGWEFGHARALSGDGKVLFGRATCGGVPTLYRLVLSE